MYFARLVILLLIAIQSVNLYSQKPPQKNGSKQSTQNTSTSGNNNYIISDFVSIEPNPFEDFIEIKLIEAVTGSVEINILSIVGKVVRTFSFPASESYVLNLSDLEKGVYLLKVNNGKSACVKRIFHQ